MIYLLNFHACVVVGFGPAQNIVLSFGPVTGAKCNTLLHGAITKYTARDHWNNIAVTGTNTNINAIGDTVVHDSICGIKCNNNDWSFSGNGAKCVSREFVY